MNKKIKKSSSVKTMVGVGAGVAALGAAAYILFGPNARKNRKVIRGWAVKMKGEIIEKFENVKELTEPVYNDIINKAEAKYAKFNNVDKKELASMVEDIKKHWKAIKTNTKTKKTTKKTKKK